MNSKSKIYTANTNLKPKRPSSSENKIEKSLRDEKYAESKIIQKYLKKGFESLAIEELAVTLISPTFEAEFQSKTGTEWPKENKAKAIERLNFAKFNIQWNASMNKKSNAGMLKSPFGVLFDLCERGDIQKITEYFKKNAQYMNEIINTVDINKKSLLHTTAKAGHTNLLTVLLQRGFSVHFRDKFLRTPLHTACQFGRETCADELIKAGSDIYARDSIGRTCLHYACCSDSVNLVTMILGTEPDLVHTRDTYGRTPLHYVVWNGTSAQGEICMKLLEAKAEVDALDDEGMTPLHFAADAAKGKIIPILLRHGANPFIRDGRTHQTSLELAATERIREIIIVYSGQEYKGEIDKLKLTGQKVNLTNSREYYSREEEGNGMNVRGRNGGSRGASNGSKGKILRSKNTSQKEQKENDDDLDVDDNGDASDKQINSLLFSSNKKKLVGYLRNIQAYGVKSMQHLTKPELYSGSWLEKISNVEDLYKYFSTLSSHEAIIAVFNVLSPYTETMPKGKGDEQDLAYFFNKQGQMLNPEGTQMMMTGSAGFNTMPVGPMSNQVLNEQKKEINDLKEQIGLLNQKIEQGKQEVETAEILKLKMQIEKYQNENESLKNQSKDLNEQVKVLTTNVKKYETKVLETQKSETAEKDKIINTLKTELIKINNEMDKIKKTNKKTSNYILSNTFKNPKTMLSSQLTLSEESSVYIFLKLAETEGLDKLLMKYDKDNDLHLLKHEFIAMLDDIHLPFEHKNPIIKVSGFENKQKMPVKKIIEAFYKREEGKNQKLNEVLYNFSYKLIYNVKNVEDLYKDLEKKAKNKRVNMKDIQDIGKNYMFDDDDIKSLFDCWENEEGDGMINIDDLSNKLKDRKKIIEDVSDMNSIVKYGESMTSFKGKKDYKEESIHEEEEKKDESNEEEEEENEHLNSQSINKESLRNSKISNNSLKNSVNNSLRQSNNSLKQSQQSKAPSKTASKPPSKVVSRQPSKRPSQVLSHQNSQMSSKHNEDMNQSKGSISNKSITRNEDITNPPFLSETQPIKKEKASVNNNEMINPKGGKKMKMLNINEKINGELKVQVKKVDTVVLPSTIKPPYTFLLGFTLEGIDKEFNSKDVVTDDLRAVSFNWSTRTIIVNKTLKDLASNCCLTLKFKNKGNVLSLGQCMFNWTKCLIKGNIDKYVIDDAFQMLNKKKTNCGYIYIRAKFIPFGSENSMFDENGNKKQVPTNLNGLVNKVKIKKYTNDDVENPTPKESLFNKEEEEEHNEEEEEHKEEDEEHNEEDEEHNEEEEHKEENNEEEEHYEEEGFDNNVEEGKEEEKQKEEEDEEEMTIIKEIDAELINIVDKDKIKSKDYYICITDPSDSSEIYSSKDDNTFSEIVSSLPFKFNFSVYTTSKSKQFSIELSLMNKSDDSTVAEIPITFSAKEKYIEISEKYDLIGKSIQGPVTFYMKYIVNTVENE